MMGLDVNVFVTDVEHQSEEVTSLTSQLRAASMLPMKGNIPSIKHRQ